MDLEEFRRNGGHAYVVGLAFSFPPRYACFKETAPSGWMWTSELTEAELFSTREQAVRHMEGDMAGLVDGNPDVVPVAVELKVA